MIKMIKQIIKYFKSKTKLETICLDKIKNALPKINYKILNHSKHYILDERYKSCTLFNFKEILKKDFTNWRIYHKDYDCDNFAFKLHGDLKNKYPMLSVGIVFSTSHAFNIFVDKFGKAWYIEPQKDKVYEYSKLTKIYKPITLIII